jgi:methionyl-tRNA formyltransferase
LPSDTFLNQAPAMRIVFMGTPDFAVPTLERLVESPHTVQGVVTAPDKPAGRGRQLKAPPVKQYAEAQALPVLQPQSLKAPAFQAELQRWAPELAVVVAFRMLPPSVWQIPAQGTINLHASLLPAYRGAAPINWAIINGETETGLTTFLIDEQIDTGQLLLQERFELPLAWTAGNLHDYMQERGAELVLRTVNGLAAGTLRPQPQPTTADAPTAPKLTKTNTQIDWHQPRRRLYDLIRGLCPVPAAWTQLAGQQLKVYGARLADPPEAPEQPAQPGALVCQDGALYAGAADGWLRLHDLQLAGRKRMTDEALLRGYTPPVAHFDR